MKRRSLTVLLCLLAIISLASVGFASWVISAGDTEEATGNIQVETVSDQRLVIENINPSKPSFVFGKLTSDTKPKYDWLLASNVDEQVVTITLTFDVKFKNDTVLSIGGENPNASLSVNWAKDKNAWLQDAQDLGYLGDATISDVLLVKDNTYKADVTLTWGKLFDNKNPFEFYNNHKAEDEFYIDANGFAVAEGTEGAKKISYADHADEYLKNMFEFFTEEKQVEGETTIEYQKFYIVISAQPISAQ